MQRALLPPLVPLLQHNYSSEGIRTELVAANVKRSVLIDVFNMVCMHTGHSAIQYHPAKCCTAGQMPQG
jgi:hypothetical protein